jgi:hypothetical protein
MTEVESAYSAVALSPYIKQIRFVFKGLNTNSIALGLDRLQHDSPTAYVNTQQYSYTTFISLRCHPHNKSSTLFKNVVISIFYILSNWVI